MSSCNCYLHAEFCHSRIPYSCTLSQQICALTWRYYDKGTTLSCNATHVWLTIVNLSLSFHMIDCEPFQLCKLNTERMRGCSYPDGCFRCKTGLPRAFCDVTSTEIEKTVIPKGPQGLLILIHISIQTKYIFKVLSC